MKKKIFTSLIISLFICLAFVFVGKESNKITVLADGIVKPQEVALFETAEGGETQTPETPESTEPELTQSQINKLFQKGYAISGTHITDNALYGRLLDVFTEYVESLELGITFTGTELYSEMFTKYTVMGKEINITKILISDGLIQSLEGIEYLRLDNITHLKITGNELTTITADSFQNMESLRYLDLSNNLITSCDLSRLADLTYVDLSSNRLSEIDFSKVVSISLEANLANNYFYDMARIKLPIRAKNLNLNVMSNNIAEIDDYYFNNSNISLKMKVGVQGIKKYTGSSTLDTATALKIYKMNETGFDGFRLAIYKMVNLIDRELYKVITDEDIKGKCIELVFPVGNYIYDYEDIEDGDYRWSYDKYDTVRKTFVSQEFTVVPQQATFKYEHNGKLTDTLGKVTGTVKVHLYCEEGGEIYYSTGGAEWVKGNVVTFTGGGSRSFRVKVVKDGFTSEIQSIKVQISLNKVIPDFLMFAIVAAIAIFLFVILIPIISKKYFRR